MKRRYALAAIALFACTACDRILPHRADLTLPPIEEVRAIYERNGLSNGTFAFSGNVVEITVPQDGDCVNMSGCCGRVRCEACRDLFHCGRGAVS